MTSSLCVILIMTGGVLIAFHTVLTKHIILTQPAWGSHSGLFVAVTQGLASVLLLGIVPLTGGMELKDGWLWPTLATGFLNIGIQYSIIRAKTLEDVSLVTPIYSTTPAAVIVTSMLILGEYPSRLGWLGVWTMVLGTYVLNLQDFLEKKGERSVKDWFAPFLMLTKSKGVRFAFAAALLSSISLNFDSLSSRRANIALGLSIIFSITALANLAMWQKWRKPSDPEVPKITWKVLLVTVFFCGAVWFSNAAFRYGLTPYVGTLKRIYIPIVILFAYVLLGEKKSFKNRLVGGLMIVAGATIISFS